MTAPDRHTRVRNGLRVLGIVLVLAGVGCIATAMVDFFSSVSSETTDGLGLFWLAFLGVPLVAAGYACLVGGFGGAVARYAAREASPAVSQLMGAAREPGATGAGFCVGCGTALAAGNRFCGSCGRPV